MRVRLLANEFITLVDPEHSKVHQRGDEFDLPDSDARILASRDVVELVKPARKK